MNGFLLVENSTAATIASGGVIPLGSAVHGYGCAIKLNGNAIQLKQRGYYRVSVSATLEVTGTGAAGVAMYADGVAVSGASAEATPAAAGADICVSFPWTVRKSCCCDDTVLTFVATDAVTLNNIVVEVDCV